LRGRRAGSPSNTMLPGSTPTLGLCPKWHLDRSIQSFGHNSPTLQTDRQTDKQTGRRQDNDPVSYRANHFTNDRPNCGNNYKSLAVAQQLMSWGPCQNKVRRKMGAALPLSSGELDRHLTMSPRPRPISVPSDILIHPAVWLQYTNVTDRHADRTTVPS